MTHVSTLSIQKKKTLQYNVVERMEYSGSIIVSDHEMNLMPWYPFYLESIQKCYVLLGMLANDCECNFDKFISKMVIMNVLDIYCNDGMSWWDIAGIFVFTVHMTLNFSIRLLNIFKVNAKLKVILFALCIVFRNVKWCRVDKSCFKFNSE